MNNSPDQSNRLIEKLALRAEETGQVLFDGQWMTIEESEQLYRRMKLDGRLKQAELVFAMMLLFFASVTPFVVLALVGGIAV